MSPHLFAFAKTTQPPGLFLTILVVVHNTAVFNILVGLILARINKQEVYACHMLHAIVLAIVRGKIAIKVIGKLSAQLMVSAIKE